MSPDRIHFSTFSGSKFQICLAEKNVKDQMLRIFLFNDKGSPSLDAFSRFRKIEKIIDKTKEEFEGG